jgi:uncharacterized repeat protein (TIGR01451 family)
MKNVLEKLVFLLAAVFLTGSFVYCQEEKGKLNLKITAQKEVKIKENGRTAVKLLPVEIARRGDIIFYTLHYTNAGKEMLQKASIIDPIPQGVVYIKGSAGGENTQVFFSINRGQTYKKPPVTYTVKKENGSMEEKEAPAEMFTHIKWLITEKLKPGDSGKLFFKTEVK